VERGAEVLDVNPVLLHRLLPEVVGRERAMWPSMTIECEIPAGVPLVSGDEASISLVIRNLLSNAAKYAGSDSTVTVSVATDDADEVTVRIVDDGPGIAADEAEHLFDLYYRSETANRAPGSGIGLFVCRQLIATMGGRTWAKTRPEGGAEFGFTLPLWADEPLADGAGDLEAAPGLGSGGAWGAMDSAEVSPQLA
jgi:signal transduction histidine kinase